MLVICLLQWSNHLSTSIVCIQFYSSCRRHLFFKHKILEKMYPSTVFLKSCCREAITLKWDVFNMDILIQTFLYFLIFCFCFHLCHLIQLYITWNSLFKRSCKVLAIVKGHFFQNFNNTRCRRLCPKIHDLSLLLLF